MCWAVPIEDFVVKVLVLQDWFEKDGMGYQGMMMTVLDSGSEGILDGDGQKSIDLAMAILSWLERRIKGGVRLCSGSIGSTAYWCRGLGWRMELRCPWSLMIGRWIAWLRIVDLPRIPLGRASILCAERGDHTCIVAKVLAVGPAEIWIDFFARSR
jgi:hypothetical protein